MIDTHTHLYLKEYFPDGGEEAVRCAIQAGVEMMVLPSIDRESVSSLLNLHKLFPDNTAVAAGLHPTEVEDDWKDEVREIFDSLSEVQIVAIGEIGIDLYWEKRNQVKQMDAFGYQLDMAKNLGIPAIIHSRSAIDETLTMLDFFSSDAPVCIFHSFTYSEKDAERILEKLPEANFGFNGVITFKNAEDVRKAAARVGRDRIVAETDSPFLAPVPHRGKINQSSFLPDVVKGIAAALDTSVAEAEAFTTANAKRIFFHSQ